jgi:hypothetical protein
MDYKLFSASVVFVFIGVVIMRRNRFYKYPTDDMLFAAELKLFLCGFLFCLKVFLVLFQNYQKIYKLPISHEGWKRHLPI